MKIIYNNIEYKLHIIKLPASLSIKITNSINNLECIVIYIPCDKPNFNYNIVSGNGMDIETIENILQLFTEQIKGEV